MGMLKMFSINRILLNTLRTNLSKTLIIQNNNKRAISLLCSTNLNLNPSPMIYKVPFRTYAKGKDKKKEKGKTKVQIDENQIGELVNIESYKKNLQSSIESLKDDFIKHLSVRSTTGAIESIPVNVDGKEHKLQELAQIVRKNPKTIVLNMAVFPQAIPAALKALQKSGLNINPQQEGTTVYIPVPKVTKEHREGLSKNAKSLFIKCRDNIKDFQNKQTKMIKKKDGVSQDLQRNVEQQLIALADSYVAEAEKILESKQNELLLGKD